MTHLQEGDGELGVHLGGDPEPEVVVDGLGLEDEVHHLLDVGQTQVAVLQQHPAAHRHEAVHQAPRVHLLTLTHRDRAALCNTRDDVRQHLRHHKLLCQT